MRVSPEQRGSGWSIDLRDGRKYTVRKSRIVHGKEKEKEKNLGCPSGAAANLRLEWGDTEQVVGGAVFNINNQSSRLTIPSAGSATSTTTTNPAAGPIETAAKV